MSYSKSCRSIGKEVVNRSTNALVGSVNRPAQALAEVVEDFFVELRVAGVEERDFFRRVEEEAFIESGNPSSW